MFRSLYISRSLQTMGELINAGVPMLDTIVITGDISGNRVYKKLWRDVYSSVKQGRKVVNELNKSGLMPHAVNQMIASCAITVSWLPGTASCGSDLTYAVYRAIDPDFEPSPANRIAACLSGTSYVDNDVVNGQTYLYIVRAEDATTAGSGPCNGGNQDSNTQTVAATASGPSQIDFSDDFESGLGSWTAAGNGGSGWTLSSAAANSPSNSVFCADEDFLKDRTLTLASGRQITAGNTTLEFFHAYITEAGFDGGVLEISTDNGSIWSDIGSARFLENGYNSTISTEFSSPIGGRDAWSGNSSGFLRTTVDLADFAGQTVSIRFRMACDVSVDATGWYIDDVTFTTLSDCIGCPDADLDGVCDTDDLCPGGDDTIDNDEDGIPDACDLCAEGDNDVDSDSDGVPDACDACPDFDDSLDADADTVPDDCDLCPGFDDTLDADGDGVPDDCDLCAAGDDNADADGDSVPDACDLCPAGDDVLDSDSDGTPDGCDLCPGFDDTVDSDGDGTPDDCDQCQGSNDNNDIDADGVPDACDICPNGDDTLDGDGDGVPDQCDICPNGDDNFDADFDNVPDACDRCPGSNDRFDSDNDGVPNGCDVCPGADDSLDADNDTVPDGCDACAGFDDNLDADGDNVPDGCDICPEGDDSQDQDGDGVPNACDRCPGNDDGLDADGDGVPDACDLCLGADDTLDADSDGVPDDCDICAGSDDATDSDGDGVPDGCDVCPIGDDTVDLNENGVPDACDCPDLDQVLVLLTDWPNNDIAALVSAVTQFCALDR